MQLITSNQLFTLILLFYHLQPDQQRAIALPLDNRTATSPEQAHQLRSPANNQTSPVMIRAQQTTQNSTESRISTNSPYNNGQVTQHRNSSIVSPPAPNKMKGSLRDGPVSTIGKPVELVQIVNNTSDGLDNDDDDDDEIDEDEDEQSKEDEAEAADEDEVSRDDYANKQTGLIESGNNSLHKNHNTTYQTEPKVSMTLDLIPPTYTESISNKLGATKPPQSVSSESLVFGREPNKLGPFNNERNDHGGHKNNTNNNTDQNGNERYGGMIVGYDTKLRARDVTKPDSSRFVVQSTDRPSGLKYSNNARQTGAPNSSTIGISRILERPSSTTGTSAPMRDQVEKITTRSPIRSKSPVILAANATKTKTKNKKADDQEQEEVVEEMVEEDEEEDEDEDEDDSQGSDENNDSSLLDYESSDSRAGVTPERQLPSRVSNQLQSNHHLSYPSVYNRQQQPVWPRNNSNPWPLTTSSRPAKPFKGQFMSTTRGSSLYETRRPANSLVEQVVEQPAAKEWTNRVVDVYHQIERAIQLMVESWKSSKTFESLADRPMILMLILAGAIIGLTLVIMAIVYLRNRSTE